MQPSLPLPGDVVWIRQRRWRVERASRHHDVVRLDVSARGNRLTFLAPFDRPATVARSERVRRVSRRSALARIAHLVSRTHGVRTLLSAVHADVSLLPHQLEPALAIFGGGARRVLVADEVGLGKTIQAGLVIAELVRRLTAPRVLIVVPSTLIEQWREELSRRFQVSAEMATRGSIEDAVRRGSRGENPWNRAGVWIASLDYLKQVYVLAALPARPWDLVVFDEAHGAAGDSDRNVAAQIIARRARRLMLLTATPHDGDEARFRRLVDLGELNDSLTVFRRTRDDIRSSGRRQVRWLALSPSPEEIRVLDTLGTFERAVLSAAGSTRRDAALLLLAVLRKRALSTMSAFAISLERRQSWIERDPQATAPDWTQPSLFSDESAQDDVGADETGALSADVGLDRRHERAWLKRLRTLADAARKHERKVRHLVCLLRRSREPVVIFTEFRHSLEALRTPLEAVRPVSVLHGGQADSERSRELRRFLDGATSVLLATDVAGLGLNLQSRSRWVVSVDLPWNPARLEQRLGRVDRIGQARPVHFTVLTTPHVAESAVVARIARRTLLARTAIGDDVLRAGIPDATAVRASVLSGSVLDEQPPACPSIAICRRWTRHGRAAARSLESRRRLARSWKSATVDRGRTRVARIGGPHTICVFTVPILDGAGNTLEEHVAAIRLPPSSLTTVDPAQLEAARRLACHVVGPRLARVQRWQISQQRLASTHDRAIARALADELRPREAQAGLFDRRAVNAFEAADRQVTELSADETDRSADRESLASLEMGRPHLALMLTSR